jgi:dihydrofolate reductase
VGRFVYWMNTSIDLRIEQAEGENGGGEWLRIDEQLHRDFNARARELTAMVQGRVVYEIMDPFWPDARTDETMPDFMREYGHIWTDAPKLLVSRTRTEAAHSTRIVSSIDELAAFRAETEGSIGVGGANVATQLLRAGLLDELLLYIHPAYLGAGRPLFDDYDEPLSVELLEHRVFDSGVAMHRYEVR